MQDLFIKEQGFEKIAGHVLSTDATKWVKEIISYFLEQYPQLQNANLSIE